MNVGLNVDSAPEARRRYFNRVTEAFQFGTHERGRRPQPDARALLRAAGIRYRVIRLADERLPDRSWTVSLTTPAPDAPLPRERPVVLKLDAADPFRTFGTACAQE